MVVRALQGLADQGAVDRSAIAEAIEKYDLHNVNAGSSGNAGGES
jgi:pyruvate dehydrogenase E1 component